MVLSLTFGPLCPYPNITMHLNSLSRPPFSCTCPVHKRLLVLLVRRLVLFPLCLLNLLQTPKRHPSRDNSKSPFFLSPSLAPLQSATTNYAFGFMLTGQSHSLTLSTCDYLYIRHRKRRQLPEEDPTDGHLVCGTQEGPTLNRFRPYRIDDNQTTQSVLIGHSYSSNVTTCRSIDGLGDFCSSS